MPCRPPLLLDALRAAAAALTRAALADVDVSTIDPAQLVLGTSGFEGAHRVFELYVPAARPEDARVIARTVVDIYTGDGAVTVSLPPRTREAFDRAD